jgi:hypothetical protein
MVLYFIFILYFILGQLDIFLEFIELIPALSFSIFQHISRAKLLLNHNFAVFLFGLSFAVKILAEIGTNHDQFESFLLLFICYTLMQMRRISL